MDHEGCWAQAGSSAQSSPCRICSLETRSMHGFGETSGSLINSLNLRLHSHSGVDDATAPIQGGAGGTTRQEREHSGVGGAWCKGNAPSISLPPGLDSVQFSSVQSLSHVRLFAAP